MYSTKQFKRNKLNDNLIQLSNLTTYEQLLNPWNQTFFFRPSLVAFEGSHVTSSSWWCGDQKECDEPVCQALQQKR